MSARAPVFLCLHRCLCLNPGAYSATVPCLSVCAAGGLLPAGRLVTIASASPEERLAVDFLRRCLCKDPDDFSGELLLPAVICNRCFHALIFAHRRKGRTAARDVRTAGKKKARRETAGGCIACVFNRRNIRACNLFLVHCPLPCQKDSHNYLQGIFP